MIDEAIRLLSENDKRIIHYDRGSNYHWLGWIEQIENAKGLHARYQRKVVHLIIQPVKAFSGDLRIGCFMVTHRLILL